MGAKAAKAARVRLQNKRVEQAYPAPALHLPCTCPAPILLGSPPPACRMWCCHCRLLLSVSRGQALFFESESQKILEAMNGAMPSEADRVRRRQKALSATHHAPRQMSSTMEDGSLSRPDRVRLDLLLKDL